MAKKMLIDATHPEETRVVVADGNKVEEFDFENLNKRQLAGNIYLAKVTRVEPSLQAAFIDYGGNRHGFLAFSEIHPDYYQIPKADRDAILAEERALAAAQAEVDEAADTKAAAAREARGETDDDETESAEASDGEAGKDETGRKGRSRSRSRARSRRKSDDDGDDDAGSARDTLGDEARAENRVVSGSAAEVSEAATDTAGQDSDGSDEPSDGDDDDAGAVRTIAEDAGLEDETVSGEPSGMETVDVGGDDDDGGPIEEPATRRGSRTRSRRKAADKDETVETVGDEDEPEDMRPARTPRPKARKYKIQEVVKVRQIMLVQVVKEERGNKGAALTTYLSLAGRYCVLMPNTARGGGISRKITNAVDRKKLKEIAQEIDVPQGAGLIVRTAGAKRTKTEIKRDYEYLQRMWEQVRELTLKSIAPAPIYEEGNLIHRSIRDLYNRDIDEVIVEGEAGFRDARDYMKLIMPSHAKNVKLHPADGQPLFAKHGVESYLASMFSPTVQLKSGGYIVIGITEALVAVDVNSGKSTKEGSIEETATKTNLEAADEVARQMRLRDLAGLIVIDFIDMDERRNNAAVEKRLKEALKNDRARLQVGRISGFGLLEMSRQRLRPGMLEATTQACPHCHGTGLIRSDDSVALQILRALEEEGVKKRSKEVRLCVPVDVCNYLMNEKREHLAAIETRYDMAVRVVADPQMVAPDYTLEKFKTATRVIPKVANVVQNDTSWTSDDDDTIDAEAEEADGDPWAEERAEDDAPEEARQESREEEESASDEQDGPSRKKRRRRSRRRKSGNGGEDGAARDDRPDGDDADGAEASPAGEPSGEASPDARPEEVQPAGDGAGEERPAEAPAPDEGRPAGGRSRRRRSGGRRGEANDEAAATVGADVSAADAPAGADDAGRPEVDAPAKGAVEPPAGTADVPDAEAAPVPKPRSRTRSRSKKAEPPEAPEATADAPEAPAEAVPAEADAKPAARKSRSRARAKAPATGPSEALTAAAEDARTAQEAAPAAAEAPAGTTPAETPVEAPAQETLETSAEVQAVETPVEEAPSEATPSDGAQAEDAPADDAGAASGPEAEAAPEAPAKPKRKGWWSFGG